MRAFLACVACRVRAGDLELHAFSLMGSHFHLLVRSPVGRMAEAMHRVQLGYSRYFNRGRKRDGPLVRARYRSKPVRSLRYRRLLIGYIDANPVRARMVSVPGAYPHGSAFHYRRSHGPPWLERSWVEGEVLRMTGAPRYSPHLYDEVFGRHPREMDRIVEARILCRAQADPLDDLVGSSPAAVVEWFRRRAALADGTKPGLPVCHSTTIRRLVARRVRALGSWTVDAPQRDGWEVALAALLVELCGSTQTAVASTLGCSNTRVGRILKSHRELIATDGTYRERVGDVTAEALRRLEI